MPADFAVLQPLFCDPIRFKEHVAKEPIIKFVPVNVSSRHDGWTAERQIAFIEALAETACVEHACRAVGMSDSAAYKLRRSARGALFREAWDSARQT